MSTLSLSSTWIEAARPKTLTAAIVPIAVGTGLSFASGPFGGASGTVPHWRLSVFALLSAVFIQIGTNLINDAIDFKKGTDNETRVGPRRVTQSGLLSPRAVMAGGFAAFVIASLFAVPLLIQGGSTILLIGALSLICGYAYTGGPFPLAYLGLGEAFVLAFFGWIAVAGVYFLHTGRFDAASLVAGLQVGALATVLIAVNNLRDADGDRASGKNTLAVRFGKRFAKAEIVFFSVAPLFLGAYWWLVGRSALAFLPLAMIPLTIGFCRDLIGATEGSEYNLLLARGAFIQLIFGALFTIACFLTPRFPAL